MSSKTKNDKRKKPIGIIGLVIIAITLAMVGLLHGNPWNKREAKILTDSYLEKVVEISALSTAKYRYAGIAQVYKDEKHKKLKCNVKYNAEVKAGIDMDDIEIHADNENKVIRVSLPDIQLKAYIVDEDPIEFMPDDVRVDLNEAIAVCEQDALEEANNSTELKKSATENLKNTIEALLYPVLKEYGYSIEWGEN